MNETFKLFFIAGDQLLKGIRTDDEYLVRYLYGNDFDVEKAFQRVSS